MASEAPNSNVENAATENPVTPEIASGEAIEASNFFTVDGECAGLAGEVGAVCEVGGGELRYGE